MSKFKGNYGKSENGNFEVIDTIGVPHPFCITPRHVAYAADHCGGRLNEKAASKHPCGMKGCNLTYEMHETALLIACHKDIKNNEELKSYLLKIVAEAESNNYAGFAFLDKR